VSQAISKEQVIVPAQIQYLPVLRKFISRIGSKYKFAKKEINAFKISIDEACTNIIKHGYSTDLSGSITMKVMVNEERLIVELIDQGKSFDPNSVSNPNLKNYVETGKKGGLGIFIMRKFLDEINYEINNHHNILRLTKNRSNSSPPMIVPITSAFQRLKQKLFPAKTTK